jgi:serine/threonine protein kinase
VARCCGPRAWLTTDPLGDVRRNSGQTRAARGGYNGSVRSIAPPQRIGSVIKDRYEVLELIGQGGQSAVFRARDRRDGDEVALKILKGEFADDSDFRERMMREAHALASLQHTAALHVLDQAWTSDGALVLVTELLYGRDLESVLQYIEGHGGRVDLGLVRQLLEPVARTLEAAHAIGIVHRDLKPANIHVIDEAHGGGTRLLDFGYAKFVRARSFTAQGTVAGSPSYIAPEAWSGHPDTLDPRVDVYGLGAVIYRCLAGRPPFAAGTLPELLAAVTTSARPSLHAFRPDLPRSIDEWVGQALAIEPHERFDRVRALWQAFLSFAPR